MNKIEFIYPNMPVTDTISNMVEDKTTWSFVEDLYPGMRMNHLYGSWREMHLVL